MEEDTLNPHAFPYGIGHTVLGEYTAHEMGSIWVFEDIWESLVWCRVWGCIAGVYGGVWDVSAG